MLFEIFITGLEISGQIEVVGPGSCVPESDRAGCDNSAVVQVLGMRSPLAGGTPLWTRRSSAVSTGGNAADDGDDARSDARVDYTASGVASTSHRHAS